MALAAVCVCAGCGGGGGGAVLTDLSVSPDGFVARVGDVVGMVAVGKYSNNTERLITDQVTWKSSQPGVATAVGGVFTAVAQGQTEISVTRGALTSPAAAVNVLPVPVLLTSSHMPLGINYQWTYTGTEVSGRGVGTSQVITLVVSIPQQVVRNGQTWHQLVIRGSDPLSPAGEQLLRHDVDGLVRHDPYGTLPVKVLDAALQVGTAWADQEDPRRTFEITSTTDEVHVDAGAFSGCVKVVETDTAYDPVNVVNTWYKTGVGLVKEQTFAGDELYLEQELVSYQFGL